MMARIELVPLAGERLTPIATTTTIRMKNGRTLKKTVTGCRGTPHEPFTPDELREKFLMLTKTRDAKKMAEFFDRFQNIEDEKSLEWISA